MSNLRKGSDKQGESKIAKIVAKGLLSFFVTFFIALCSLSIFVFVALIAAPEIIAPWKEIVSISSCIASIVFIIDVAYNLYDEGYFDD